MQNPTEPHWAAVKRTLRYLKNIISHALLILPTTDLSFKHSVMQIGHLIVMIEGQLVLIVFI